MLISTISRTRPRPAPGCRSGCSGLTARAVDRHVADRGLRVGLDLRFARGGAAPRRDDEAGTAFHRLLERVVTCPRAACARRGTARARSSRFRWISSSSSRIRGRQAVHRQALLLARVAPGDQHRRLLDVLGPDLEAQRHAAQLPLGELPARTLVALVERDADAGRAEARAESPARAAAPSRASCRGRSAR